MGKGCLRFKTLPDLALDVVESTVARLPVSEYMAGYQAMRDAMDKGKAKAKPAAKTRTPAKETPAETDNSEDSKFDRGGSHSLSAHR